MERILTHFTSYSCHCPPGFKGNRCERNIDDCVENKCENNSTCIDMVMSYRCQCQPGYTGIVFLNYFKLIIIYHFNQIWSQWTKI